MEIAKYLAFKILAMLSRGSENVKMVLAGEFKLENIVY